MKQQTIICSALLVAVLLAGLGLNSMVLYNSVGTLTDPNATFTYWMRLPGGRLLWVSKRPACRPALSPMVCQADGRTDDPRLSVDVLPTARPVRWSTRSGCRSARDPPRRGAQACATARSPARRAVRPSNARLNRNAAKPAESAAPRRPATAAGIGVTDARDERSLPRSSSSGSAGAHAGIAHPVPTDTRRGAAASID